MNDENYKLMSYTSLAKQLNDRTLTDYFYRLMLLARSIFEWDNLPNGIDEKWIERFLFGEGKCVFFKDKEKGYMITKCTPSGMLNYYDEPTTVRPYGTNYTGEQLENNVECVVIRNNDEMIPTSPTIQLYAMQLTKISRTIDVNVQAQKTPVLIQCSDKQKISLKNVYSQWNENEPVIFADKNLESTPLSSIKTDAPIVFDKLQIQKHAIWNECMTFLGINNANMDKRERLVDDEVRANDEQIQMSANVMLKAREQACKQINEMFGLNITVKMRNICDNEFIENNTEGGENND